VKAAAPGICEPRLTTLPQRKTCGWKTGAAAGKGQAVKLVRFAKPPVIDGKLDDEVLEERGCTQDFIRSSRGDNIAPSKPTK